MIALQKLQMLALGELGDAEAAAIEEHALGCGECASTLEHLHAIGVAVGDLVRSGHVSFPASDALIAKLKAAGLISRAYHLAPDHALPCAVGSEDVYALTTLEADLANVKQVDVLQTMPGGSMRMTDVPFDAERGLVRFVTRSEHLRALPRSVRVTLELFSVDKSGGERKLSEYFLDHTAFRSA